MTGDAPDDPVVQRLDQLLDLFQRRLLEDKTSRRILAELTERTQRAEAGLFREHLHPLVVQLARIIDRLDRHDGPDVEFALSIRDELLDALAVHGVVEVDTAGEFDPARHEAVEVSSDERAADRAVTALLRRGYRHGDWVFRPAQVAVNRLET
jgi:molecular chaperone GrpE (heat shock protein)